MDIVGITQELAVVLKRTATGKTRLKHSPEGSAVSYTLFSAQPNQKLIPLVYSKINTLNLWLYPLSTGPITTTTYINTNEMNKRSR